MNGINNIFNAIDHFDPESFASHFTDNASFKFGNADMVFGRDNIKDAVTNFFSAIKAIEHSIENNWVVDKHVFIQGQVTYTRHNDTRLTVPFANILEMNGDKVATYQIYADISRLFAT